MFWKGRACFLKIESFGQWLQPLNLHVLGGIFHISVGKDTVSCTFITYSGMWECVAEWETMPLEIRNQPFFIISHFGSSEFEINCDWLDHCWDKSEILHRQCRGCVMILSLPHCWKQKFQQLSEDFSVFRIENHSENFFTGNACRCAWNVFFLSPQSTWRNILAC